MILQRREGTKLLKQMPSRIVRLFGLNPNSSIYIFLQKFYWKISQQSENYKTYSQFGEDRILRVFLPEAKGSYLDVGGGSYKSGNNTYFLYKRGWRGTVVEPLSAFYFGYRFYRGKDTLVKACVSDSNDREVTFYEFHPWQLSTVSKSRCDELIKRGIKPRRTIQVPTKRIDSLNLAVHPLDPFLLCVDVEGAEQKVLDGIDWSTFRPRVICLEEFYNPIIRVTAISKFLDELGYQLISQAFLSSIYVHRDYLQNGFRAKSLGFLDYLNREST